MRVVVVACGWRRRVLIMNMNTTTCRAESRQVEDDSESEGLPEL